MSVPTNLIPTPITGLPEYTGSSTLGYLPYILNGQTFKVQFANIAAVGAVPSTRVIASGTGLAGGGDLSADRVISIAAGGVGVNQLSLTGVTAGTYGSGSAVPVLTVDATGRVTSATTAALSVTGFVPTSRTITAGNGLTGGGSLASDITLSANFSTTTPLALGSATAGVAITLSRGDHVHPALDLSDTNQTQGALPLGRGGTGDALSPVAGAVVYSTGTKFALSALGLAGQVLVSNGTSAPSWLTVPGTGTVTSVNASGGTTGLSFTGGPITTSGTLTLGGTLAIANGGTGATTLTSGYLVKGNGTSAVSASVVYDTGTNVGIGTSSPGSKLHVYLTNATDVFKIERSNNFGVYARWTRPNKSYILALDINNNGGNDFTVYDETAGASRLSIGGTGNVGIGTSSPADKLTVNGFITTTAGAYSSTNGGNAVKLGAAGQINFGAGGSDLILATNAGNIRFGDWNTNTERMRITSGGNLLLGTTVDNGILSIGAFSTTGATQGYSVLDNGRTHRTSVDSASAASHYVFYNTNGAVGSISTSGTATTYNTSSDVRLKQNIADADDASNLIDAIQVRKFDWKADGSHQRYGFVAQELITVAPEAVSQPEDPDDMMGVDYSKLVPMLVKEVQSLRARVAQLEGN